MPYAVAVDLGATSGRFAVGSMDDGLLTVVVIRQIPHTGVLRKGRWEWQMNLLLGLCRDALAHAESLTGDVTLGIDSWGVDHGFLTPDRRLIRPPVCYRDDTNTRAYEALEPHRHRLYELTGIQHQPFNTICQLIARGQENPELKQANWLILPDLLGVLLGGEPNMEFTQASTTQLMGLDGAWSEEAFAIAGWPVPALAPELPGQLKARIGRRTRIATVGSHDTASAVAGFGTLADDEVFLNVGTWSLVGCVLDQPLATPEAEAHNFTNERMTDGRVRFLKNVPGFFVINRIHEDLKLEMSVPEWLATADLSVEGRFDVMHQDLYNPKSMVKAVANLLGRTPKDAAEWAGVAILSLAHALAAQPAELTAVTGRPYRRIRMGGGGSQSVALCQALADASGLPVVAGPVEATLVGNLAVQFLAAGAFADVAEMNSVIARSTTVRRFEPSKA